VGVGRDLGGNACTAVVKQILECGLSDRDSETQGLREGARKASSLHEARRKGRGLHTKGQILETSSEKDAGAKTPASTRKGNETEREIDLLGEGA